MDNAKMNASNDLDQGMVMDKVMKDIYSSCDIEHKNSVPVSELINYIRPYMQNNLSELQELQNALDPNETNPCVDSETFYQAMSEWTTKIKDDSVGIKSDNSFHEANPEELGHINERDLPYTQSTPRASFGHHLLKGLNLSNVSCYSLSDSQLGMDIDAGCLEEKVKELEYHLGKANDQIEMLKQQLLSTEEHNEVLQSDLKEVKKQLSIEQHMVDKFQKDKKEYDDLKEELTAAKLQMEHMRNNYLNAEKKAGHLSEWLQQLEAEKLNLEKRIEKSNECSQSYLKELIELKSVLDVKYEEICNLENENSKLKIELGNKDEGIDHLKKTNDLLKHENLAVKKAWKKLYFLKNSMSYDKTGSNTSFKQIDLDTFKYEDLSNIPPNLELSAVENDCSLTYSKECDSYNSPKFLNQIANPVSPNIDSSQIASPCVPKHLTTGNEDSPTCPTRNSLLKNVLLKNASTPQRTIFDDSLPHDVKKLPVMDFTEPNNSNGFRLFNDMEDDFPSPIELSKMSCDKENSPPIMYVINRTPDDENNENTHNIGVRNVDQVIMDCNNQLGSNNNLNLSSDDDLFWKCHLASLDAYNVAGPCESLKDEIENAKSLNEQDNKISELEKKLEKHENCEYIINSYKNEITCLAQKLSAYEGSVIKCAECDRLVAERNGLKEELQKALSAKNNLYERLEYELDNGKKLTEAVAANAELQDKLSREGDRIIKLEHELIECRIEMESLKNTINELEENHSSAIDNYNLKIDSLHQTICDLRYNLQSKNNDLLLLNEKMEEAKLKELSLKKECDQQMKNVDMLMKSLTEDLKEKECELIRLATELKNQDEIKHTLWQDIQTMRMENERKSQNESKCADLENKCSELETSYKALCKKYSLIEDSNEKLMVMNSELQSIQKDQKELINKLHQDFSTCRSELEKFKNDEHSQQKILNSLREENFALKNEVSLLSLEAKDLKQRVSNFNDHLNKEKLVNNDLMAQFDVLKQQLEDEHNKSELYEKQIEVVGMLLKEVSSNISDEKFSKGDCNSSFSVLNNETLAEIMSGVCEKIEKVVESNRRAKGEIELLNTENENMKCQICNIQNELDGKRFESEKEIEETKTSYMELQKNFTELLSKLNTTEKKIKHSKIKIECIKKTHATLRKKKDELMKQNSLLLEETKEMKEKNNQLLIEVANLKVKLSQETEDHKKTRVEAANEICSLKRCLEQVKDEIANLESQIHKYSTDNYNLLQTIEHLSDQLQKQGATSIEQTEVNTKERRDLEKKLEQEELNNVNLRKLISDMTESNALNCKDYESSLTGQLQEIEKIKTQLQFTRNELAATKDLFPKIANNIFASTQSLINSTILALKDLKHGYDLFGKELGQASSLTGEMDYNYVASSSQIEVLIDQEIVKLNNQIYLTSKILEYLALQNSSEVSDSNDRLESLIEGSSSIMNATKPLNKFTLRPSKLIISCPASPDSPSTGNDVTCDTYCRSTSAESDIITDYPDISELAFNFSANNETMESADEQNESDAVNLQPAFPSQPDTFLESLDLLEESPRKMFSKGEMEEKFTALVLTWTVDRDSAKKRFKRQHLLCRQYEKELIDQLTQIIALLISHNCSSSPETVIPAVDQLEIMKESIHTMFTVAEQCGVLRYEIRNTKCWNLVINYVASLKQEIDASKCLSLSIESDPCPKTSDETQCGEVPKAKRMQISLHSEDYISEDNNVSSISFCGVMRSILFILMLVVFVIVGFVLNVHWQCTRSGLKKPVCPLDYISEMVIKQVHTGIPPL